MFKKLLILVTLAISFSFSSLAQAKDLCVFYIHKENVFFKEFHAPLEKLAKSSGFTLQTFNANGHYDIQSEQIAKNLINCDGSMVATSDKEVANLALSLSVAKRLPIVFFNRRPPININIDYDYVWYVGTNPKQAGHKLGVLVKDYIKAHPHLDKNEDNRIDLVMLGGDKDHSDTHIRNEIFIKYMIEHDYEFNPLSGNFLIFYTCEVNTLILRQNI